MKSSTVWGRKTEILQLCNWDIVIIDSNDFKICESRNLEDIIEKLVGIKLTLKMVYSVNSFMPINIRVNKLYIWLYKFNQVKSY